MGTNGYSRGTAEPAITGMTEKFGGGNHLVDPVHTVLNADPPAATCRDEHRKNAVVVVAAPTDYPLLERGRIPEAAVGFTQAIEVCSFLLIAIGGLHGHDAVN